MPGNRQQIGLIEQAARKHGVPPGLLFGIWGAESTWSQNRSAFSESAPYAGPFALGRGLGAQNRLDFGQSVNAAARLLASNHRQFGNWRLAVAAYNAGSGAVQKYHGIPPYAETQTYVPRVFNFAKQYPGGGGGAIPAGGGGGQGRGGGPIYATRTSTATVPDAQGLQAAQQQFQLGQFLQLGNPFEKGGGAFKGLANILPQTAPNPADFTKDVTKTARVVVGHMANGPSAGPVANGGFKPQKPGKYIIAPGANYAGQPIHGQVLSAVAGIAGVYGRTLTIGTGTHHGTVNNGRRSDHQDGNAVDIPAAGSGLTNLGHAALRFFGQPLSNGLHTFNWRAPNGRTYRVQVIFNIDLGANGGNHWNHLHVGMKPI